MNSFYFFSYLFRFVHFFLKFAPMGAALRSAEKFSQPWQKRLEGQLAPDKAPSFCRISYPSRFARNAGLC